MKEQDVYERMAEHLSRLGMGYPRRDALIEILKVNFTPREALVALAVPTGVIPLQTAGIDEILKGVDLGREELESVLEDLSERGLLFSGDTGEGKKGYALHQVGYGFPQTFYWKGQDTPHARKMARLTARYFERKVISEAFSGSEQTKAYRYIPVGRSLEPGRQAVYPHHMMETVIEGAKVIALAHCACRMTYAMLGRECSHPTDVCMKFNDTARYVIERGFGKEISREEALKVIDKSEEAGLVHFVDNAEGDIQHNCNCCGCACWNVGTIRRRKIPRDVLMATYFLRRTDEEACTGCGACIGACPVDAVTMIDDAPVVDEEWCIGCGVCAVSCPGDAVRMVPRPDKPLELPGRTFRELHGRILKEKDN